VPNWADIEYSSLVIGFAFQLTKCCVFQANQAVLPLAGAVAQFFIYNKPTRQYIVCLDTICNRNSYRGVRQERGWAGISTLQFCCSAAQSWRGNAMHAGAIANCNGLFGKIR